MRAVYERNSGQHEINERSSGQHGINEGNSGQINLVKQTVIRGEIFKKGKKRKKIWSNFRDDFISTWVSQKKANVFFTLKKQLF